MHSRRDELVKSTMLVAPTIDFWHPLLPWLVGSSASELRSQALECRIEYPVQDQGGTRSEE